MFGGLLSDVDSAPSTIRTIHQDKTHLCGALSEGERTCRQYASGGSPVLAIAAMSKKSCNMGLSYSIMFHLNKWSYTWCHKGSVHPDVKWYKLGTGCAGRDGTYRYKL